MTVPRSGPGRERRLSGKAHNYLARIQDFADMKTHCAILAVNQLCF